MVVLCKQICVEGCLQGLDFLFEHRKNSFSLLLGSDIEGLGLTFCVEFLVYFAEMNWRVTIGMGRRGSHRGHVD